MGKEWEHSIQWNEIHLELLSWLFFEVVRASSGNSESGVGAFDVRMFPRAVNPDEYNFNTSYSYIVNATLLHTKFNVYSGW